MTNDITRHIGRFILILMLQVLIFRQFALGESFIRFAHILIYPVILLWLPIRLPQNILLLISFVLGIIIDIFYDSLGVHASASVFLAFVRPFILQILEPRGGYSVNTSPTRYHLGFGWFVRYMSISMIVFCFFYFSVEAFSFVYIKEILLSTLLSFIFSMLFILLYQFLFNPK